MGCDLASVLDRLPGWVRVKPHAALLRLWPVDRRVGSPRNNGPELPERIAA
jgi:hypothetical protein